MTPVLWKYLITKGDGSAIRFVAAEDREWAEKDWKVCRAFLAIQQNHNLNAQCLAVLPNDFCSGCDGHGQTYKEWR